MGRKAFCHVLSYHMMLSVTVGLPTQLFFAPGPDCNTVHTNLSGAVIESDAITRASPEVCEIRLMTSDKWLVHVDHLIMDWCPVTLHLFDDTEGVSAKANFSCGRNQENVPATIDFESDTVTFRLTNTKHKNVRFKIVLTAYKNPSECPPSFMCGSGTCISRSLLCDGVDNCLDGRDEIVDISDLQNETLDCHDRRGCRYFSCISDGLCVPGKFVCDAVKDCVDGSDEDPDGRSKCEEEEGLDTTTLIMIFVIVGVSFCLIGLAIAMAVIWRTRPALARRLSFRRQGK